MSHSTTLVVIRNAEDAEDAIAQAEAALEPYNENMDIDPYTRWESEKDVARAVEYYTQNPSDEIGPKPETDDNTSAEMIEWTRRAIGMWGASEAEKGVHEDGKYGYLSTYNPQSKWDWYCLGGRWSGFFLVKEGAEAELGEEGVFGRGHEDTTGRADVARKGDIDIDKMRSDAEREANERYDAFEKATEGLDVPPTWAEVLAKHGVGDDVEVDFSQPDSKSRIEAARAEFNSYPWVAAVRPLTGLFGNLHEDWFVGKGGREAFVANARNSALGTFSMLMDNEWSEQGEMGWFGMSNDKMSREEWATKQNEVIDSLPDDVWLLVYDLHI